MADLHPEVLKEIEAGPQSICDHHVEHIPVMRNESLEEFASRIALRQQELDAVCAWSLGMEAHNQQRGLPVDARNLGSNIAAAIRRGKP